MKTAILPAILRRFSAGMGIVLAAHLSLAGAAETRVWARTIMHPDGSRTESSKNDSSRVIEQLTYSSNNILVMKRIIQLDANGKSRQGFVFDGRNDLIYKISYEYDEIDRLREETLFNIQGQVVRRQIHEYDASGKPLRPKAFSFATAGAAEPALPALRPEAVLNDPQAAPGQSSPMPELAPGYSNFQTQAQPKKKKKFLFFFNRKEQ